jgi:HSP20 family protein
MELVRWEPFEGFSNFHSRINDFFDETLDRPRAKPTVGRAWYPGVDILESKEAYLIRAELPGMKKEDFNLEVKDGTLTLCGERKSEETTDGIEYRSVERVSGKFFRSFTLPESVRHDGIQATYKDGILEIQVPKAEEAKPRRVEISVH